MRYAQPMLRPGMTALAAALALTSTPLLAQAIDTVPAEPSAPVVEAAPAAPAAALNIPKISVDMSDAPATAKSASSDSSAAPDAPKASGPVRAERSVSTETPAPVPVKQAPAAPAATPAPAPQTTMTEAPAPVSPLPTPPVAVEPETQPAMAPAPVQSQASADTIDETLPIAGGVLAALALAGGALAFAGRKRRYREEYRDSQTVTRPVFVEPEPLTLNTPVNPQRAATTYTPQTPVAETAGVALPAGFDMSRYGRHVQAAYRGPTAENPSLSLRKRLKRARFYDQRERMGTTSASARPAMSKPTPAAQPARQPEFVTSRRFNVGGGNFQPAYQG